MSSWSAAPGVIPEWSRPSLKKTPFHSGEMEWRKGKMELVSAESAKSRLKKKQMEMENGENGDG